MDIQIGHFYQDREGETIKVLARARKHLLPMLDPLTERPDTDPAHAVLVDCFLCRDYEGVDYYILPTGQACNVWKGKDGEAIYSVPDPDFPSYRDLVKESAPEDIDERRYEHEFTTTWRLESALLLTLKIRAGNAERVSNQLPPISEIEKALRPLFVSAGVEVEVTSYEHGEIEEEETDEGDLPYPEHGPTPKFEETGDYNEFA